MSKYLGFVVVYNLLPADYADERVEEIEKATNTAISSAAGGRFQATEENMLFHFSEDRSVRSAEIPVVLHIKFLVPLSVGLEERDEIADTIRAALLQTVFRQRGEVVSIVSSTWPTASFSPRE